MYGYAEIGENNDFVKLSLEKVTDKTDGGILSVSGLATGEYEVLLDGEVQNTVNVLDGAAIFKYNMKNGRGTLVIKKLN